MLQVELVDTNSKRQVDEFVRFPFKLYQGCTQWVPPIIVDIKARLNRKKHPFYEHSDGDLFIARRNGEMVGRLAILENRPFNHYHGTRKAQFYFFDSVEDQEVCNALFDRAFEWVKKRNLTEVVGPKGLSAFDGYGIQVKGFEHRQMMTMMNYNWQYYPELLENYGFEKEVDFVSCYINPHTFRMPEKVHEIARRVQERGTFQVKTFRSKRELLKWALKIGKAYNDTFVNNWEYYPLSQREIEFVRDDILAFADHRLIKIITYKDEQVVGFLLGFPDVSSSLQRHGGRLTPWALVDLMLEMRRTNWLSLNGVGILPEFQGRGGNALLYTEMEKTMRQFHFDHVEQTQMADTAVQVRRDMASLGAEIYKAHRIFHKAV